MRLEFNWNSILQANACKKGTETFLNGFKDFDPLKEPDRPINFLNLLEINGITDTIWALRANIQLDLSVSVNFSKNAAVRAAAYAAYAAYAAVRAADAASAAVRAADAASAAAYAAYVAVDADAPADAASAAVRAADAASAAAYASYAAVDAYASYAAVDAYASYDAVDADAAAYAAAERKKQKEDLILLLGD